MADTDYIGKDKLKHFAVCLAISIVDPLLAIGAALGKEYGDSKATGNHWCYWDLFADFVGIGCGCVLRLLVKKWIG